MSFICVENLDEVFAVVFDRSGKVSKKTGTSRGGKKGKNPAAASSAA